VPCGVIITRKYYLLKLSSSIEYLNSIDSTIMGSRNGHASLYLWYALSRKGVKGLQEDVLMCIRNSQYLREMLTQAGVVCSLNNLSSTVVFEKPSRLEFIKKWQLACEGKIAHVIVMPNITREKLEEFVGELIEERKETQEIPL
jgi:histidine decarboxylase